MFSRRATPWVAAAIIASVLGLFVLAQTGSVYAQAKYPVVALDTTMGVIKVELFTDKAPITTKNFLEYVKAGFYDGTIVHRIDFVIGMGGYTANLAGKQTRPGIENESKNGVKNSRGTISMARYADPNSATSQFFINLKDNTHLDPPPGGFGYAVFGRVLEGMDVVDKIAAVKVANKGNFSNVPVDTITVKSAKVVS
jgi:cyclophilin family peptidyl-prolyl cis-trans isomerase